MASPPSACVRTTLVLLAALGVAGSASDQGASRAPSGADGAQRVPAPIADLRDTQETFLAPDAVGMPAAAPDDAKGHVFVLNTDIRLLACDMWLLPVSRSMAVDGAWNLPACERPPRPHGFGKSARIAPCRPKSDEGVRRRSAERYRTYAHPLPVLAHVLSERGAPLLSVAELMSTLREFLAHAASHAHESKFGRALPLIALPIFGSGLASEDEEKGDPHTGSLIALMLDELSDFVQAHPIDVALCTLDNAAFGAALNARRKRSQSFGARCPPDALQRDEYRREVLRLAELFLAGRVSLFLGAGVSINAGLPGWSRLLEQLALELGLGDGDGAQLRTLRGLDPLEAASVLAFRAGGGMELKRLVARIIGSAKRHSLQHALLAGLPFRGCITTNYDELFERAIRCTGGDIAVLPVEMGAVRGAWCLKMHGSVSEPQSIVLTRADYSQFSREQAACEGVLQGLLLTQHVLFVGFGMRDENWCRISSAVKASFRPLDVLGAGAGGAGGGGGGGGPRGAAPPTSPPAWLPRPRHGTEPTADRRHPAWSQRPLARELDAAPAAGGVPAAEDEEGHTAAMLGTVLSLLHDDALDTLYQEHMHVTALDLLAPPAPAKLADVDPFAWHARSLEIFLDHVVSAVESRTCRILLNNKFSALLSPNTRALRACVEAFLETLPDDAKKSGAFQPILTTLLWMGLRTEAARALISDDSFEGPYYRRLSRLADSLPRHVSAYREAMHRHHHHRQ